MHESYSLTSKYFSFSPEAFYFQRTLDSIFTCLELGQTIVPYLPAPEQNLPYP
ncbi:hypothetical protein X474_09430 [Dethiosulfatarculus sandiegensis]|uniref:Uncharacterized protein n=1 Tax=Dethiosulfatarculus sandiegensis TaxID=1429043 RepID=A0A0D2JXU6_9BACT|nr:hypothetical protein X474_09430 [Dethiosulfatarculus sandiegensis]